MSPPTHRAHADDWRVFLATSRAQAVAFLESVKSSPDLRRVRTIDHGFGEESWSVRKALRRLVSHERLHSKSIARIIGNFRATRDATRGPDTTRR